MHAKWCQEVVNVRIGIFVFHDVEELHLHLVGRLHSAERRVEVRRHIQYDPEPTV